MKPRPVAFRPARVRQREEVVRVDLRGDRVWGWAIGFARIGMAAPTDRHPSEGWGPAYAGMTVLR